MKTVCFFASYFTGSNIPYYTTVYLKELKKHFNEVVLLSSQKDLSELDYQFLKSENIELLIEKNEGFDFGLWFKAFQKYDVNSYDRIALVNDSCILFKPLDEFINWSKINNSALQGMTFSDAISPHIQSYFLIINKQAIKDTEAYFLQHKILNTISDVISTYEVGLSTYLISKGHKIDAFVDNNGYSGEFSPYYYCVDYHIERGLPIIKKKIMFSSYRKDELFTLARMGFNISKTHYLNLIQKYNTKLIIDLEKLMSEKGMMNLSFLEKIKYALVSSLVKVKRKFK